jgi:HTH-type transcriptional regulator / antitoxin HigA
MNNNRSRVKPNVEAKVKPNVVRKSIQNRAKKGIQSKEAYELTMKTIDGLMRKGEKNLNAKELKTLEALAAAAEVYEDTFEPLPTPTSLPDMIRMKLYQLRINQHLAAQLLGVSNAKFSLIMNGKQRPDIVFVKAVHEKLELDANLILQAL